MSSDMITEFADTNKTGQYNLFLRRVGSTINLGYPLVPGPVRQPNNPRAFCTGDWKIVQYIDPKGVEKDRGEENDPDEMR
jgi:hypothetical protein